MITEYGIVFWLVDKFDWMWDTRDENRCDQWLSSLQSCTEEDSTKTGQETPRTDLCAEEVLAGIGLVAVDVHSHGSAGTSRPTQPENQSRSVGENQTNTLKYVIYEIATAFRRRIGEIPHGAFGSQKQYQIDPSVAAFMQHWKLSDRKLWTLQIRKLSDV